MSRLDMCVYVSQASYSIVLAWRAANRITASKALRERAGSTNRTTCFLLATTRVSCKHLHTRTSPVGAATCSSANRNFLFSLIPVIGFAGSPFVLWFRHESDRHLRRHAAIYRGPSHRRSVR